VRGPALCACRPVAVPAAALWAVGAARRVSDAREAAGAFGQISIAVLLIGRPARSPRNTKSPGRTLVAVPDW
jgi:hypothetical protein